MDYNQDAPFFPTALRWGLIGGAASIAVFLLSATLGWNDPAASMSGEGMGGALVSSILGFGIYIIFQVLGVKQQRDEEQEGYISFSRAFVLALVIAVIMAVVAALFQYIYMNFIDPGMMERMLEATRELYEEMGMEEDQIEASMSIVEMTANPIAQVTGGLIGGGIIGSIFGLIVAAVMKKEPPLAA